MNRYVLMFCVILVVMIVAISIMTSSPDYVQRSEIPANPLDKDSTTTQVPEAQVSPDASEKAGSVSITGTNPFSVIKAGSISFGL